MCKFEGKPILNSIGRFEVDGYELTSGTVVHLKWKNQWHTVRIEHNGKSYYLCSDKGSLPSAITPDMTLKIEL